MLTVRDIWRYPVKSMGGERLDATEAGPKGIPGDRGWGVRDLATGNILTGRRAPALLMATAHLRGDRPVITVEDGSVATSDDDLSDWLGQAVELVPATDGPGTFENPMDAERETDWISWQGPEGTFHDSGRTAISLASTATLDGYEPARFRLNVLLDGAGEDDLVGTTVGLGGAHLTITKPIDRCVMVSRAQPGLSRDLDVLRRVVRERSNKLGIGAIVTTPGSIVVGDSLTPG